MSDQFACPSCGAPLDYDGSGSASMRCPFCNNSVVVPEELRTRRRNNGPAHAADVKSPVSQTDGMRQVRKLARRGETAQATHLLHELTGLGQEAAVQAVAAMTAEQPAPISTSPVTPSASAGDDPSTLDHVNQLLHAGKEAKAARVYDAAFHVGPQQALEAVRAMYAGHPANGEISAAATSLPASAAPRATARPARPKPARAGQAASFGTRLSQLFIFGIILFFGVGVGIIFPVLMVTGLWNDLASRYNPFAFGQLRLAFGSAGIGPGYLSSPGVIAVDSVSGRIYVGDEGDGRVQAFDHSGKFLTQWSVANSKGAIGALAVDRSDVVYVAANDQVNRYDGATGALLGPAPVGAALDPNLSGGFNGFESLALGADGSVTGMLTGGVLVRVRADGHLDLGIPKAVSKVADQTESGTQMAVDGRGQIYILGTDNDAVFVFSREGKYLTRFGSEGNAAGQFRAPNAIAVDNQGRVYVADFDGILVFDSTGRYLSIIDLPEVAYGLAFDDQNNLYAVTNQARVVKYAIVK